MKKNKKLWLVFLCGLIVGALIMELLYYTQVLKVSPSEDPQKKEENLEQGVEPTDQPDDAEPVSGGQTPEAAADTWDKTAVYVGGDEVAYNGKIYRAKWWTQGEEPGKADVWEDTLVAAVQPSALEDTKSDQENIPARTDVEKQENFKVIGYFPSWKENTDMIQYDVLTHINYAFAIPTEDGKLLPLANEPVAQKIIKEAHKNNVKVFLAVGGWSYNEIPLEATFVAATETEDKRTVFAKEIVSMCDKYGFDGVDMDWEHPRVDGGSSKQYEALMQELAKQLHAEGKQLSSAVLSGVTADGNVYYDAAAHTDAVLKAVDWINVMAYDGGDGERHSAYEFAVNCGNYWNKTRGLAAEKVILGVPFYARPSWASYGDIISAVPDAWKADRADYNGMDVWYNGVSTIEKKTDYALEHLGGVMIWEISQDAPGQHSLQTAIGRTVKNNKK